jgi:membrane-associated phospholipid phosphatase
MDILKALASLRNPVLDKLMQGVTYLGEELVFMAVALILFWCVDKWKGYFILAVGFIGTILNQFLKLAFRVPRPWVKDPSFEIVESARNGAGGYSFPSGHTQNAVGTFGGIARGTKKTWLRVVLIVLSCLIAFSRMYLGVHYPTDVGVALVTAMVLIFVLYPIMQKAKNDPRWMYGVLGCMTVVAIGYLCYLHLWKFPADLDADNYSEGLSNGWKLFGALVGLIVAYTIDERKIRFREQAPLLGQICKVVVGLALIVGLKSGLKAVFGMISDGAFWDAARYFLIVVFAGAVWPLSFPLWQKVGGKK